MQKCGGAGTGAATGTGTGAGTGPGTGTSTGSGDGPKMSSSIEQTYFMPDKVITLLDSETKKELCVGKLRKCTTN